MEAKAMNQVVTTKTFPAKLDALYLMLKYIKEHSTLLGFPSTIISKIELAAEEAIINIITHGYKKGAGEIEIECNTIDNNLFQVKIIDQGIPFNPLTAIKHFQPENMSSLELEDQVGGYGIYFIIHMMDKVDYERIENKNILTLKKFLPSSSK